jgi:hypothetical protein
VYAIDFTQKHADEFVQSPIISDGLVEVVQGEEDRTAPLVSVAAAELNVGLRHGLLLTLSHG